MISATGLVKSFGGVAAVRGIGLAAADGAITGLLGPNGAGKSTTLRMLCTVLAPDAGEASIDGAHTAREPLEARRRLGVLTHDSGLYPHLSARENILYFAELHGMTRAARERRADELIDWLEMRAFAGRRARGYSQGQRIKTALARALVHGPRNVLLDEPTNGLDVMAVRNLRVLLRRLRDAGHCVLFSSHVMQEVSALCDVVIVLARGTVVARGTPDELRERTGCASLEDAFVQLIGSDEGLG